VGDEAVETVRKIYGFNWAAVGTREVALEELAEIIEPDFESKMSEETGGRTLRGVVELRQFGEALEQDFEQLAYEPRDFIEGKDGRVVVLGRVSGVGRASRLPLAGEFGHVWTIRDGKAAKVEAYLDRDRALKAAGASPQG
jgi:ketosteroid isomerase-like protein